jgi:DNA mismatch repair protein MutL
MPTLDFEQETAFEVPMSVRNQPPVEPTIRVNPDFNPFQSFPNNTKSSSGLSPALKAQGFGQSIPDEKAWQNFYQIEEEAVVQGHELIQEQEIEVTKEYLTKDRYIFTPTKSGLMLIDRKRAQERITYDMLMAQFINSPIYSQQLLFPYDLELSKNEKVLWESNKSLMQRFGFEYEMAGNQLLLNGIPSCLPEESIYSCLENIHDTLGHKEIDKGEIAHYIVLSIAKSVSISAIKSKLIIESFIENLFQCEDHQYSPSGKKILSTLTLEEIKSKF